MRHNHFVNRAAALLGVMALGSLPVHADTVTLDFSTVFSGHSPAGAGPWLSAVFTDTAADSVRLTVTASGLTGSESVAGLYFNLGPLFDSTSLLFTRDVASTGPTAANISISQGVDLYRADGDGYYDILFDLPPPPGQQAARFTAGETLIYSITGAGISAASFLYLSAPGPGHGPGPQYAAAHIQQIGASHGSGWVAATPVPLPGAVWLLLSGLGLAWRVTRRAQA